MCVRACVHNVTSGCKETEGGEKWGHISTGARRARLQTVETATERMARDLDESGESN